MSEPGRILSDAELDTLYADAITPMLDRPAREHPRVLILGVPKGRERARPCRWFSGS